MTGGGTWQVSWRSEAVTALQTVMAAARTGIDAATTSLLEASQELVPVRTGALQESGQITPAKFDGRHATGGVSYGNPGDDTGDEAVIQHENTEYEHPDGGQAKYLEQPMLTMADDMMHTVGDAITDAVGGAT